MQRNAKQRELAHVSTALSLVGGSAASTAWRLKLGEVSPEHHPIPPPTRSLTKMPSH